MYKAVAAAAQVQIQPVALCCMSLPLYPSPFHTCLSYPLKAKKPQKISLKKKKKKENTVFII
ncbi:hypothetical protein P3565_22940 [Vibrio parahaemolyticus]|nr:hypothetical protein [Vibrio parahaemolyticus]